MKFPRALNIDYHAEAIRNWIEERESRGVVPIILEPCRYLFDDDDSDDDMEIEIIHDSSTTQEEQELEQQQEAESLDMEDTDDCILLDENDEHKDVVMEQEVANDNDRAPTTELDQNDQGHVGEVLQEMIAPASPAAVEGADDMYAVDLANISDSPIHQQGDESPASTSFATATTVRDCFIDDSELADAICRNKRKCQFNTLMHDELQHLIALLHYSTSLGRLADAPWQEKFRKQSRPLTVPKMPWMKSFICRVYLPTLVPTASCEHFLDGTLLSKLPPYQRPIKKQRLYSQGSSIVSCQVPNIASFSDLKIGKGWKDHLQIERQLSRAIVPYQPPQQRLVQPPTALHPNSQVKRAPAADELGQNQRADDMIYTGSATDAPIILDDTNDEEPTTFFVASQSQPFVFEQRDPTIGTWDDMAKVHGSESTQRTCNKRKSDYDEADEHQIPAEPLEASQNVDNKKVSFSKHLYKASSGGIDISSTGTGTGHVQEQVDFEKRQAKKAKKARKKERRAKKERKEKKKCDGQSGDNLLHHLDATTGDDAASSQVLPTEAQRTSQPPQPHSSNKARLRHAQENLRKCNEERRASFDVPKSRPIKEMIAATQQPQTKQTQSDLQTEILKRRILSKSNRRSSAPHTGSRHSSGYHPKMIESSNPVPNPSNKFPFGRAKTTGVAASQSRQGLTNQSYIKPVSRSWPASVACTQTQAPAAFDATPGPVAQASQSVFQQVTVLPVRILCSENFLQTWSDLVAELGSGHWEALKDDNELDNTPILPNSVAVGRQIELIDTPLLDERGVDIELPNRQAIIVHSVTAFGTETDAKQLVLDVARLAVEQRYRRIHIIVCCDTIVSASLGRSLASLINAVEGLSSDQAAPSSTTTSALLASPESLSASIAAAILAAACPVTDNDTAPPASIVHDPDIIETAKLLIRIVPKFTATGAVQCIQLIKALAPGVQVVPYVFESVSIQNEIMKRCHPDNTRNPATEINPEALQQLNQMARAHSLHLAQ